jgi:lambda family phage portal protein
MKQDLITQAIAFISPQAAMSRMISQAKLRNFGRFDSALDSTKRGISRNVSGAEDTAGTTERYKLIRAARDLADNFPPIRSLLLKFATYVSGRLNYQARTGDRDLDMKIERYWRNWCSKCDFLRRHDFVTLLQLAVMAVLRDGDCGFVIVRDQGELRLQSVESDRIGSPYNRLIDSDNYIGGIVLDDYGRPDQYELYVRTISNQYIDPTRIPAAEFIHLFDPTRLDEYRGRSAFATALNAARDLQEALKAEIQAIKFASYQTGIIMSETGAAEASDYFASSQPNDFGQRAKLESVDPGTMNYLSPGEKMEMFENSRPTGAFGEFVRLVQSHICMSVGLPYGFSFDADKSGPMARMEAEMADRTFARWRRLLETQFLDRIKNIVLLDAASRGLIPDNEYLLDGRWGWPRKASIDYGREARADIDLWKAGLKTAAQIYSEGGEDYEEALRTRAKEAALIVDLAAEYQIPAQYISDSVPIPNSKQVEPVVPTPTEPTPEPTPEPPPAPTQAKAAFEDSFKPTAGMIAEAEKGLEWREKFKRGGTSIGVARARDISNGKNLSEDTVKRMHSFFSRHEVDKKGEGFQQGEDGFPSAGRIAWALWGGDAGQVWAADKMKGIRLATRPEVKEFAVVVNDVYGHFQAVQHETAMVMPEPGPREQEEDFIDRCMVNATMESEYPDFDQRLAVCMTQLAVVGERGGIKASPKAPKSDTPNKDPQGEGTAKGDASGKRGAEVTAEQEKTLQNKADEFNEKDNNTKNGRATLGALKSVFQRGLGAFNTSHSPRVQSAEQWAFARVNAFLYLLKNGRPENPNYTTDNDLLPKEHPKAQ